MTAPGEEAVTDDHALNRLSALAGIEEGWVDFFGQYRLVSADTKRAFLTSMGFEVASQSDIAASLTALEARPWRRWLDPVLVSQDSAGPPMVKVTVPIHRAMPPSIGA